MDESPKTITLYAPDGFTIEGASFITLEEGENPTWTIDVINPKNILAKRTPSAGPLQSDGPSASASAT